MSPSTRRAWIEILWHASHKLIRLSSPSTRRAWIEIDCLALRTDVLKVALHPEGVDRNLDIVGTFDEADGSPSTRRAWIEIDCLALRTDVLKVALHPEGVDRNCRVLHLIHDDIRVALHPEGVDRNSDCPLLIRKTVASPSTRRAWIEI